MPRFFFFLLLVFLLLPDHAAFSAGEPERVSVGAYIHDIQEIDLRTHSYRLDLYVWFRWRNPALDPSRSAEFMNAFNPADHVRTPLYDAPQKMPDGSLYMLIRDQGQFSVKFPLQRYPFDRQQLAVMIEDSLYGVNDLVYVPDDAAVALVSLNPRIRLPGFNLGAPGAEITAYPYPTNFGDLSQPEVQAYSRVSFSVPVARPWLAAGIKVFVPVALIVFCTALVLFVHPAFIEGRLGVAITALLTLVALQLTTASGLPDVDYLLLTDKIYLLSYLFVIATLMQVVRMSKLTHAQAYDAVQKSDRRMLGTLALLFFGGTAAVLLSF